MVTIDHVKAIIQADKVILFGFQSPSGADLATLLEVCLKGESTQPLVVPHLLRDFLEEEMVDNNQILASFQLKSLPFSLYDSDIVDESSVFELRALEAMLISVTTRLDAMLHSITRAVSSALSSLEHDVTAASLKRQLPLKDR
jgi:hypothetical protein